MTATQIEVWLDTQADDGPVWCVSLCDDDGQEVKCLDSHDGYDDAIEAGLKEARKFGVRLCERDEHGHIEEIASSEAIRMQSLLLSHGERFSGNNVVDEANGWFEEAFDSESADEWCQIGVWDAATAAKFRDAGLTPDRVKVAAESLVDGLDDPIEVYTNGDPIYAACNGNLDIDVIIDAARAP